MFMGEAGLSAQPAGCEQLDVEEHSVQQFLKVHFQFQPATSPPRGWPILCRGPKKKKRTLHGTFFLPNLKRPANAGCFGR
jgi:hypothetical protein